MIPRPLAFVAVGCGGFAVQMTMLAVLTSWAAWPIVPAAAVATESAVLANFLWHERWTWADRREAEGRRLTRLVRFHAANALTSIAGGVGLTWLGAQAGLPPLAASALGVVLLAAVNYRAADRWVFTTLRGADHSVV